MDADIAAALLLEVPNEFDQSAAEHRRIGPREADRELTRALNQRHLLVPDRIAEAVGLLTRRHAEIRARGMPLRPSGLCAMEPETAVTWGTW